jgi:hypothetical protein
VWRQGYLFFKKDKNMSDKTYEGLLEDITEQIDGDHLIGAYSHNIIALVLKQIAEKFGDDVAHKAIVECNLEDFSWSSGENDG